MIAVLSGNLFANNAHKTEQAQINNIMGNFKIFDKQQLQPKLKLRGDIIKIRNIMKTKIFKNTKNQQIKELVFWKSKQNK